MAYESESLQGTGASNDATSSANAIKASEWVYGNLSSPTDVDYFKFSATDPGLLTLSFDGGDVKRNVDTWRVDLLNAQGDYVRTLGGGLETDITATEDDNDTTHKSVVVSNVSTAMQVGDTFTKVTTGADTVVYKVVSATALTSGGQTLVLDKAWSTSTDTTDYSILLDPARLLANGSESQIDAVLPSNGTYYVKVSALAFSDASYALRTSFTSLVESDLNNTLQQAIDTNNRLVKDLTHKGEVDTSDTDTWLISTAAAGEFKLDFAAGSADAATAFNVDIKAYTAIGGLVPVLSSGQVIGGSVTDTQTWTFDAQSANAKANSFVVTVTASSLGTGGTGAYTLKISGAALDVNDAPVIHVGTLLSGEPNDVNDWTNLYSAAVQADGQLMLSDIISATDADTTQTLEYKLSLTRSDGSASTASLRLDGAAVADGTWLSADDWSRVVVQAGTSLETLNLGVQVRDSSGLSGKSGYSSIAHVGVNVVDANAGVTITTDTLLSLVEGQSAGSAGYSETLQFKLTAAPQAGETVTLTLGDPGSQFDPNMVTKLNFTTDNWDADQSVVVKARDDGKVEGADQSATMTFTLSSQGGASASAYAGLQVAPLVFSIADPANRAPVGSLAVTGTARDGETLTAAPSDDFSDADGLGTLAYTWQRSADEGVTWTDIANAGDSSYTLQTADGGQVVRAVVTYVDGGGTVETISSAATTEILGAPTSSDAALDVLAKAGYQHVFQLSDFDFHDPNSGDSLAKVVLTQVPAAGLTLNGTAVTAANTVVSAAEISAGKLVLEVTDATQESVTMRFKVSDGALTSVVHNMVLTLVPNHEPVGSLSVSGTSTFTAATSDNFGDADGLGTLAYAWQISSDSGLTWSDISGADQSAYTLQATDVGQLIRAVVSYDDGFGTHESVVSEPRVALVSSSAVSIGQPESLLLEEGVLDPHFSGYGDTLSFSLKVKPQAGETVTLSLGDENSQLNLSKSELTFDESNYSIAQDVVVTAKNDKVVEGNSQQANLTLAVSSQGVAASAYAGLQLDALVFGIADPSNHSTVGALLVSGTESEDQTLTAAPSADFADANGLGTLAYTWQRSADDGVTWSDIANAGDSSYTLQTADGGQVVRAVTTYTDGMGTVETVYSVATKEIQARPTSSDGAQIVPAWTGYQYVFQTSDFAFQDANAGDTFNKVILTQLPDGQLTLNGTKVTAANTTVTAADIADGKLVWQSTDATSESLAGLRFKVSDGALVSDVHDFSITQDQSSLVQISGAQGVTVATAKPQTALALHPLMSADTTHQMDLSIGALSSGETLVNLTLMLDSAQNANGFWVQRDGYWQNLATAMTDDGQNTSLELQLQDGGVDDVDAGDGSVTVHGAVSEMPLSVIGLPPETTDGLWF